MDRQDYIVLVDAIGKIKIGREKIESAITKLESGTPVEEYIEMYRTNRYDSWKVRKLIKDVEGNTPQVQLCIILGITKEEYEECLGVYKTWTQYQDFVKFVKKIKMYRALRCKPTDYIENSRLVKILAKEEHGTEIAEAMLEEMNSNWKELGKFNARQFVETAISK